MASSGVLSGSLNQLRLQRGTVRIPIVSSAFLTNITIVGDTFQIATLDEFILDTVLKPSAASTDINYTVELFNETTGMVLQSFDCVVAPVSAPDDQSWLFTINVVDVTHFYSLRITTTTGNPDFTMSLSGPTFTMVISSLTATGGGAPISATPPIFVVANNITLGAAGSNATSPTMPDAASSVTWSPFDAAHKALVLQGKAAQAASIFEVQDSTGALLDKIDAAGNVGIGVSPLCPLNIVTAAAASANGQEIIRLGAVFDGATPGSGAKINFTDATNAFLFAAIRGYTFGPGATGLAFDTGFPAPTTKVVIDQTGQVGIGTTAPAFLLDVNGDAHISGKLTVDGPIDPPSLSLTGANNAVYVDWADGQNVPVGAANHGRIIYNAATQTFQASQNGGAFTPIQIGTPPLAAVLASGNTTGANNILITVGQQIDTAAAGVLNLGNTNATAAGIGNPAGGLSTFQMFINQGGATLHGSNAGLQFSSTTANRAGSRYNQYGANAGVPGITGFKSRGATVGSLASVADGDTLWRATAIGVAADNATIPLAGFISIQVPTGGTNVNWVATDFALQLVPLAGPINSRREVFKITSEAAADFINGTTAPVTVAGHGAIRYNNATPAFEVSLNGGAWTAISTGGTAFSAITTGVNTTATMTVGSGASIKQSGTGAIGVSSVGTGVRNIVLGQNTGSTFTVAEDNVLVGDSAGATITAGILNIVIGTQAGGSLTTGGGNINIGAQAGVTNTVANNLVAIGNHALLSATASNVGVGGSVGLNVSTGADNTLLGTSAGGTLSTGSGNILLGASSDVPTAATSNTFIAGSDLQPINDVYFGKGFNNAIPTNYTIHGVGSSANGTSGADITIAGGIANQNADSGGNVFIQTAASGAGTTLVNRIVVQPSGNVGINCTPGAFTLDVNGDTRITGKLTVTGAIDPTSLSLTGANNAIFVDWADGQNVPVSAANHGRIRYNANTQIFEQSSNGAAYTALSGGGSTAFSAITTGANTTATMTVDAGCVFQVKRGANPATFSLISPAAVTGPRNTLAGLNTGSALTSGVDNTLYGNNAGNLIDGGIGNTVVGSASAEALVNAIRNTVVGASSLQNATSDQNTVVGYSAGNTLTTGVGNVIIGTSADMTSNAVTSSVVIGRGATGFESSVVVGNSAGSTGATGLRITAVGFSTARGITSGTDHTFVGDSAGIALTDGLQCTFIGSGAGTANTSSTDAILIGFNAASTFPGTSASSVMTIGNVSFAASSSMTIGHGSGAVTSTGARTYIFGASSGTSLTSAADNIFIGFSTGANTTTGGHNVFIGTQAGQANTTAIGGTFVGYRAGESNTVGVNTFVGNNAGLANTTGDQNVFVGQQAGAANVAGSRNTIVGYQAGLVMASATDTDQTLIGWSAGVNLNGSVGQNTCVGAFAGEAITNGSANTLIGYGAGGLSAGTSNSVAVGNNSNIQNAANNCIVIGQMGTVGDGQISIGWQVGFFDPSNTGTGNIFVGTGIAFNTNTTASNNTLVGNTAAVGLTTGSDNTILGFNTGTLLADGSTNTLIGSQVATAALVSNTDNTIVGAGSGVNVVSNENSVFGAAAGLTIQTGGGNTLVGTSANVSNNTDVNTISIGISSIASNNNITIGQNTGTLGMTGVGVILIGGSMGTGITSAANVIAIGDGTATQLTTGGDNVFIGFTAGTSVTTGSTNVLIGSQAGVALATGQGNVIIGSLAGNNTTGTQNTFVGQDAGQNIGAIDTLVAIGCQALLGNNVVANNTGTQNTAVGNLSLTSNSSGSNNTAVGYQSGLSVTSGGNNVFFGVNAGENCVAGNGNTVVGSQSGATGDFSDCTFVGFRAGVSVSTLGIENVFIGSTCAALSTDAVQNVVIGFNAAGSMAGATDNNNTLIGWQAGVLINGSATGQNTGVGGSVFNQLTTGSNNVALGFSAGNTLATGDDNILIGQSSRTVDPATIRSVVVGSQSVGVDESVVLGYNTGINQTNAASGNVLIGKQTGNSLTNGQNNVFMGWQTGTIFDTGSHNIAIGDQIAGGAGFAFCTLLGSGLTATATNDLQLVSGDCGLQRADPAVIAFTGGGQIGVTPGGAIQLTGIPTVSAPPVAPANSGRIYYDSTLQQFMFSKNTGAYVALTIP